MDDFFYYNATADEYVLKGALSLDKMELLLEQWVKIRSTEPKTLFVNCSQVEKADSSFLAFLVEMRRWAHEHHQCWHVKKLPLFLKGFLTVYGIEEFLKNDKML